MELYQLRTFVTVADIGNLTHAAERLFTSQPAISAHVKALEQELNVKLFDRTPKGMRLTEHGKVLQQKAKQVLTAANDLRIEATMLTGELKGEVKIGLNTDAEFLKLAKLHDLLSNQYEQLKIQLDEGISIELLHEVKRGELDGTFFFGDNPLEELNYISLKDANIVIAGAEKWHSQLENATAQDLAKLPWIYPLPFCPYSNFISELFSATSPEPKWAAEAASENSMNALLRSGVGLALIRMEEAQPMVESGLLKIWAEKSFTLPLNFAYLKKRSNDPLIQALLQSVKQCFSV